MRKQAPIRWWRIFRDCFVQELHPCDGRRAFDSFYVYSQPVDPWESGSHVQLGRFQIGRLSRCVYNAEYDMRDDPEYYYGR